MKTSKKYTGHQNLENKQAKTKISIFKEMDIYITVKPV